MSLSKISVIEYFEKDVDGLINDYIKLTDVPNFNDFAKLWKQKKFYLVFDGLLHVNQLHEFVDEIFELCLKKLKSEEVYLKKVVIIFLLFSFYFKQPDEKYKFRIRADETYLESIRSFIDECKLKEHNEPPFCWYKLLSVGAVDFVCEMNYYGPWYIRRQNYDKDSIKLNTVDNSFLRNLKGLEKLQSDYDKLKLNVEDGEGREEISELDLIEEDKTLFTDYLKKFENLKKNFNNHK